MKHIKITLGVFVAFVALTLAVGSAYAAKKPNILVVWGDDVGRSNISRYTNGVVGYKTPNIDRIAKEGMTFTDYYGEQSCTAGRSSFITGQSVFRTGLSKVGLPGAKEGMHVKDPTIAGLLKSPRDMPPVSSAKTIWVIGMRCCRPTMVSTSFFGNLYHLNAEEEPENEDYPKATLSILILKSDSVLAA